MPVFVGGDGKPRNALLLAGGFYFEIGLETSCDNDTRSINLPQIDPGRQTEPLTCSRFLPCLSMPDAAIPADVLFFFMALPFFADSTPRAYRLKAGNADLPISTRCGTFPSQDMEAIPSYCRLALTR